MSNDTAKQRAALEMFDWFIREYVPAFLDLAKFGEPATTLRRLPKITGTDGTRVLTATAGVRQDVKKQDIKKKLPKLVDGTWETISRAMRATVIPPSVVNGKENDIENVAYDMWELVQDTVQIAAASGKITVGQVHGLQATLEQDFKARFRS